MKKVAVSALASILWYGISKYKTVIQPLSAGRPLRGLKIVPELLPMPNEVFFLRSSSASRRITKAVSTFGKVIFLLLVSSGFADEAFAEKTLRLAVTTSTYETGLLDYILPPFEKKHNVKIHIISVGTGKALKLGENGDVDIILVHAPDAEKKFVSCGWGVNRRDVMYNDFVILGPKNDPAKIAGSRDAKEAFKKMHNVKHVFVSRADASGTHKKEKSLWAKAECNPQGAWYIETGQGMSATLRVADEKNAYVLADRGTYLFNKEKIRLKKLVENDKDLFNPYGVIAVSPYRHPHVRYKAALSLIGWLTSLECQEIIDAFKINGSQLFYAASRN